MLLKSYNTQNIYALILIITISLITSLTTRFYINKKNKKERELEFPNDKVTKTPREILKEMGPGICIGNSLESRYGETYWGNPYITQDIINGFMSRGIKAFRIPIKDWVEYTYNNYLEAIQKVNEHRIDKVRFDIAVQEALPLISNYIINENPKASDTEIMKVFQMPKEIVEAVMAKPISQLRKNKDNSERIKALKDKLKELKKFDPVVYTEEIINKL